MGLNEHYAKAALPDHAFDVVPLVESVPVMGEASRATMEAQFQATFGAGTTVCLVRDIDDRDLSSSPKPAKLRRALQYGRAVITDTGSIGNLIDAVPREQQEFSTLAIISALHDAGVIDSSILSLRMGTSGAVLDDDRGAEVIEMQVMANRTVFQMARAASADPQGILHVDSLHTPERVLLENEVVLQPTPRAQSNALLIRIEPQDGTHDLYACIAEATRAAGIEHCAVRATVTGPLEAKMAVIRALPKKRIQAGAEIAEHLVPSAHTVDGTFHFMGSISTAVSRHHERWGELVGNPVYAVNGHYHGFSEDGSMGGHVVGLYPQPGSVIEIIIEPAQVVQVRQKNAA